MNNSNLLDDRNTELGFDSLDGFSSSDDLDNSFDSFNFDDEELDQFKGRSSDSYNDSEVEEFRYVMYTMQQNEVREWMECLQAREIELPDELKEECYSMMNEID